MVKERGDGEMRGQKRQRRMETDGHIGCTRTEGRGKTKFAARLQRLKDHHERCLWKYLESILVLQHCKPLETPPEEPEPPLEPLAPSNSLETGNFDSESYIEISESLSCAACFDQELPPLEAPESIILTKDILDLLSKMHANSDASIIFTESSEDDGEATGKVQRWAFRYVSDDNCFFFSTPEAETHLRRSNNIRQIAKGCREKVSEAADSEVSDKDLSFIGPSSGSLRGKRKMPPSESCEDSVPLASSTPRRPLWFESDSDDTEEGPSRPKRQTVTSIIDDPEEGLPVGETCPDLFCEEEDMDV